MDPEITIMTTILTTETIDFRGRTGEVDKIQIAPPVTECSFCGLIRDKDVPQDCLSMNFDDRHQYISNQPIWANNCLACIKLSLEEREKVLHNNELQCKMCLQALKPGSKRQHMQQRTPHIKQRAQRNVRQEEL